MEITGSGGGSSELEVGVTTIVGGTNGLFLYDNNGVLGEVAGLTKSQADTYYLALDQTTPQTTIGTFTFTQIIDSGLIASSLVMSDGSKQLISIANNSTAVEKFLSQTSSGTPSWQTVPSQGLLTYYLTPTASTPPAGYLAQTTAPYSPKTTLPFAGVNTTRVLQNFITPVGFPNLAFIPAGQYEFHIHADSTNPASINLYAEFWEVSSIGTDIGLIGTTETTAGNMAGSEQEFRLYFVNANVYTMGSTASRIVCRVWALRTSSSHDINLYVGGEADSHISLPSNTVDATNFVPYTGATADVNLGSHNLTVNTLNYTTLNPPAGGGASTGTPYANLSGYSQQAINMEGLINGENLILTAGTGLSILPITVELASWNVTGATTYWFYKKTAGGVIQGVFAQNGSLAANAHAEFNIQDRIVLAPGETLWLHTNTANVFLSMSYHQWTSGTGPKQFYIPIDNAQNYVLYTCPAGKTASIFTSTAPATSSITPGFIGGYNTSSASPTYTIWLVKSGSSAGNANKITTFSLGAGNVTPAFGSVSLSGGLAAGDSIIITSSSALAGQYAFVSVLEE